MIASRRLQALPIECTRECLPYTTNERLSIAAVWSAERDRRKVNFAAMKNSITDATTKREEMRFATRATKLSESKQNEWKYARINCRSKLNSHLLEMSFTRGEWLTVRLEDFQSVITQPSSSARLCRHVSAQQRHYRAPACGVISIHEMQSNRELETDIRRKITQLAFQKTAETQNRDKNSSLSF